MSHPSIHDIHHPNKLPSNIPNLSSIAWCNGFVHGLACKRSMFKPRALLDNKLVMRQRKYSSVAIMFQIKDDMLITFQIDEYFNHPITSSTRNTLFFYSEFIPNAPNEIQKK